MLSSSQSRGFALLLLSVCAGLSGGWLQKKPQQEPPDSQDQSCLCHVLFQPLPEPLTAALSAPAENYSAAHVGVSVDDVSLFGGGAARLNFHAVVGEFDSSSLSLTRTELGVVRAG
ncbi:hypothetical protein DPX16_4551 [Anabarilius grahami]|uniref:Uncharacterized protein n=1 Tax=Anabarilius grahami TaxID=495550 RepID=A0A3N0YBX7_ANAGA|nr:hypothetical protein DPX16_4551 [Anabarilius grahami]